MRLLRTSRRRQRGSRRVSSLRRWTLQITMEHHEQLELTHRNTIVNCDNWWRSAHDLMISAAVLRPLAFEYFKDGVAEDRKRECEAHLNTFFLLAAFALENALKAYIVRANRDEFAQYIKEKKRLPEKLKSHDLEPLAVAAGIPIPSKAESEFLTRMSRYAIWAGRYPSASHPSKTPTQLPPFIKVTEGWIPTKCYSTADIRLVDTLMRYLEHTWKKERVQPGDTPNTHSPSAPGVGGR